MSYQALFLTSTGDSLLWPERFATAEEASRFKLSDNLVVSLGITGRKVVESTGPASHTVGARKAPAPIGGSEVPRRAAELAALAGALRRPAEVPQAEAPAAAEAPQAPEAEVPPIEAPAHGAARAVARAMSAWPVQVVLWVGLAILALYMVQLVLVILAALFLLFVFGRGRSGTRDHGGRGED